MQLSRGVLNALLPPGSLWSPEGGGGFDNLLDGIATNHEVVRAFLASLAYLRDPMLTPMLSDLELEYGIYPDNTVADATRRARLLVAKTAGNGDGSLGFLQNSLIQAGFSVSVYDNNPAVDPGALILHNSSTIMGNATALFGETSFGSQTGSLLVNGPLTYEQTPIHYAVPTDPGYWPLIFFLGGEVTRDGTGAITNLGIASVPLSRQYEFVQLIIRYKPLHSWAALQVQYV